MTVRFEEVPKINNHRPKPTHIAIREPISFKIIYYRYPIMAVVRNHKKEEIKADNNFDRHLKRFCNDNGLANPLGINVSGRFEDDIASWHFSYKK